MSFKVYIFPDYPNKKKERSCSRSIMIEKIL